MNNTNKKDNLYEGPNWDSTPKPKGVAALTLGKETKVYIPGVGWQFPATARKWAKEKGYTVTLLFFWLQNVELAKAR